MSESAGDQTRLDELFGELVQALTDGREVDLAALLADRADLLPRAAELLELARQVTVRRPVEAPRFPGYEILSEIGRGGMGRVYCVRHLELKRVVALKTLPAQWLTGDRAYARFEREARAVARLQHPGIVPLFDVGEAGGVPYFTMEFVKGRTLAGVLDGLRALGKDSHHLRAESVGPEALGARSSSYVKLSARIVRDVARALDHAHSEGVVHRDVKPSNILLRPDGTPLLFDFGLARIEAGEAGDGGDALTMSGEFLGTPHYVSPEQAAGRHLSASTDIFSLGATLYELLTLERPFTGVSTQEVLRSVQEHEPRPASRLNREVPRDLATICEAALAKEPGRRYATAAAMAEDLDRFLEGHPVAARAVGPLGRGWRLVRRKPAAASAVALGVLLLVATPTALYLQQRSANVAIGAALDVAEEERDLAREVTAVLESMFDSVQPENGGRDVRVIDVLADLADDIRSLRPEVRAPLERTLGNSYFALTLYDEGRAHLERALEVFESLPDAPVAGALGVRADLCSLAVNLGHYAEALELSRAALADFVAAGLVNGDYLHVVGSYSTALSNLGHADEAVAFLEAELEQVRGATAELPAFMTLEQALGLAYSVVGRLDEAIALLRGVHARQVAKHGRDHPDPVAVLCLLAQVTKESGDLETAAKLTEEALAGCLEVFGEEAFFTITVAHNLAGLSFARGQTELALEQETYALELAERALPEDHQLLGYIFEVRSTLLSELGRHDEALASQRRSHALRLGLYGEHHALMIQARIFLARRLLALGQIDAAEDELLHARTAFAETPNASLVLLKAIHLDLVRVYRESGDEQRLALAEADLDTILELMGE
ncbi:MAG: serine/threonine-protein kinase [Planctomycetota bacterium]|nr:serine/threonine-protein kinase [Planctomycetota bacterium]